MKLSGYIVVQKKKKEDGWTLNRFYSKMEETKGKVKLKSPAQADNFPQEKC